MEEDQENFNTWYPYDWDPTALNYDPGFEIPSQTNLPAQTSLVPVPASADSFDHSTASVPPPDTYEVSEPQYGPAVFNQPDLNLSNFSELDDTASFAQLNLQPNWTENMTFDPFVAEPEQVTSSDDAFSYLGSQEPIEFANSFPLAQRPRSMEDEIFSPLDFQSNSATVCDAIFDQPNLQEPIEYANFVQAPTFAEDDHFPSLGLNPDSSMAIPEIAPTSFEQPALPVDTTMMARQAVAKSSSSAMPFGEANFPNAPDLAPYLDTFKSPPRGMDGDLHIPLEQSQPASMSSLSHRRGYVPIRPKATEVTQNTNLSSAQHPRDSSNVSRPSSEVVLAAHATSSTAKGKRKRSRSPSKTHNHIPEAMTCVFPASGSTSAPWIEQLQPPTAKRNRSTKACLRCQLYNLQCSARFPCQECQDLFQGKVKKYSQKMIAWRYCIDSDLLELNFFFQINLIIRYLTRIRSLARVSTSKPMGDPTASGALDQRRERVVESVMEVVASLIDSVEETSIDDGISQLFGLQLYRYELTLRSVRATLAPPLFWMKRFLSRKALRLNTNHPHPQHKLPSLVWMFLATVLLSKQIEKMADVESHEMLDYTAYICYEFYNSTASLLKKAKNGRMDSVKEEWAALNESLTAIYLLTMYPRVRERLERRMKSVVPWPFPGEKNDEGNKTRISPTDPVFSFRHRFDWSSMIGRHFSAMREDAWDHLRDYTQHWLEKLGEGPGCFGQVMVNTFNMNKLCRLQCELEDDLIEPLAPDFHQQSLDTLVGDALTTLQTLNPGPREQQARMCVSADRRDDLGRLTIQANSTDIPAVHWLTALVLSFDDAIAKSRAEMGPCEGKSLKIKAPEDFPEDTLGFFEPPVPILRFRDRIGDLFSMIFEDQDGYEDEDQDQDEDQDGYEDEDEDEDQDEDED